MDEKKLAELLANQAEVAKVLASFKMFEAALGSLSGRFDDTFDGIGDDLDKASESTDKFGKGFKGAVTDVNEFIDSIEKSFGVLDRLSQKYEGINGVIHKVGTTMRSLHGLGEGNGSSGVSSMLDKLGGLSPMGPIFQVLMQSQIDKEKFSTEGRNAMLNFSKTSSLNPGQITSQGLAIGQQMKLLSNASIIAKEEISQTFEAFASGGAKAEEMSKELSVSVEGFGNKLPFVAAGLDKAFGVGTGTVASFATALSQDTALGLDKNVELMSRLGAASRATGLTFEQFAGNILRVTSALRMQGSDAEDLAKAYFSIADGMAKASGKDISDKHISNMAGQVTGDIGDTVLNMGEGLKAKTAEALATRYGLKNQSVFQNLESFSQGFQNNAKPKSFELDAIEEAAKIILGKNFNYSDEKQAAQGRYALMNAPDAHFSAGIADAVIRGKGNIVTGTGADYFEKERAKHEKDKDLAEKNQPLSKDPFEKAMQDVQNLMNALGQMTIGVLNLILSAIIGGIKLAYGNGYGMKEFNTDMGAAGKQLNDAKDVAVAAYKNLKGDLSGPFSMSALNMLTREEMPAPMLKAESPHRSAGYRREMGELYASIARKREEEQAARAIDMRQKELEDSLGLQTNGAGQSQIVRDGEDIFLVSITKQGNSKWVSSSQPGK